MKKFIAATLLSFHAQPVVAQDEVIIANWTCSFTSECFEKEACAETSYEVMVSYDISALKDKPGHGAGSGEIVDITATKRAVILHQEGAFVATAFDLTSDATIAPDLLQIFAAQSGEARLVSSVPSLPQVITYHGQCKDDG